MGWTVRKAGAYISECPRSGAKPSLLTTSTNFADLREEVAVRHAMVIGVSGPPVDCQRTGLFASAVIERHGSCDLIHECVVNRNA
jgi:hypothetical protein